MTTISKFDQNMMQCALELAEKGKYTTSPNPRVGCVLVKNSNLVGEGFHLMAGTPHAEIHALHQAGNLASGSTAYVTLEPCSHYGRTPPCAQALIDHKIKKVFIATLDPNPLVAGNGIRMLQDAGIDVHVGLLGQQAQTLNRGFFSRFERKRPFIKLKCATSLDGKIALNNGQSKWITSAASRDEVQKIRAESCAILTGVQTVIADNPQLNVRNFEMLRQPIRIIADSHLRTPIQAKILENNGHKTVIATCETNTDKHEPYLKLGVEIVVLPSSTKEQVDLHALISHLAKLEINELMVEAGATLGGALLQENLVDEIIWFQAAKILGDKGKSVFLTDELNDMNDVETWEVFRNRTINETDICLILQKMNKAE